MWGIVRQREAVVEREEEEEEETKARKGRRGGEDVTSVSLSSCAQLGTILLVVARSATYDVGSYCNIFRFGMVTTFATHGEAIR